MDHFFILCLEFLEVAKHFFNVPGFIFILGIDRNQLSESIKVNSADIYDEQNKCAFIGDSVGAKQVDSFLICNANSPYWNEKAYHSSVEKLRNLNFETLCISHFGCITGNEAKSFLDESLIIFNKWKEIFEENSDKLDDIPFLEKQLWEKVYSHKPKSFRDTVGLSMQNFVKLAVIGYRNTKKPNKN